MHHRNAIVVLVTALNLACNTEGSEQATRETPATKKDTMEQNDLQRFSTAYAAAWSSQRPESVAAFFAPDGSLTVNKGTPAVGAEPIAKVAEGFMSAFPDMVVQKDSLVIGANGPEFHWTLIGTNTGPNGSGHRVRISGVERWTMSADGLVRISDGSFDATEYERQIAQGVDAHDQ